jgi:WhiB family redox-sensing transcriptional regulator
MTNHQAARAAAVVSAFPDPGGMPEWPTTKRPVVVPLPARVPHDDDWYALAECRGTDLAIFFPERGGSYERALDMCNNCPVSSECLEAAMDEELSTWGRFGMRGGLSASQRERLQMARDRVTPRVKVIRFPVPR